MWMGGIKQNTMRSIVLRAVIYYEYYTFLHSKYVPRVRHRGETRKKGPDGPPFHEKKVPWELVVRDSLVFPCVKTVVEKVCIFPPCGSKMTK